MFNFNSRLAIAQLSSPEEPVPPTNYGGIERVVADLVEGQIDRGHQVELLASGESKTRAMLHPIAPFAISSNKEEMQSHSLQKFYRDFAVGRAVSVIAASKVDIVHNHIGWQLLLFNQFIKKPVLTTIHGPLDMHHQELVYKFFKAFPYVSISNNQRKVMPDMNYVATVYNGIDTEKFSFNDAPEDYFVYLSRITKKKGVLEAIDFAKKSKAILKIAGNIHHSDKEFFEREVKPSVDGKLIQYVGEVNHEQKNELLSKAKALLALIQWEEPFGLFMIEAMACGTPVIALRRGSVPELIVDKETGFIVDDVDGAIQAAEHVGDISRRRCRDHVTKNFSIERMLDGYERAYQEAIKQYKKYKSINFTT